MTTFGVDGCRGGWFYVKSSEGRYEHGVVEALSTLVDFAGDDATVFVDIPIGLHDSEGFPRECDVLARKALGHKRGSSVFPAPNRAVLEADTYAGALEISRRLSSKGLSKQAFAIGPKIREVDKLLTSCPRARRLVREIHPEICFWAFAGGQPMENRKKTEAGFAERKSILDGVLPRAREVTESALGAYKRNVVARDDIADALIALATGASPRELLRTLPPYPPRDSKGLPMEMVYSAARIASAL